MRKTTYYGVGHVMTSPIIMRGGETMPYGYGYGFGYPGYGFGYPGYGFGYPGYGFGWGGLDFLAVSAFFLLV